MRHLMLLLALSVATWSVPPVRRAHAQEDIPEGEASPGNTTLARQRFLRGLENYDAADFDSALVEFQASLELYVSPNSLLYVARCQDRLGQAVAAYASYQRTLALAEDRAATDPRYRETAAAARAELASVQGRVGRLRIVAEGLPTAAQVFAGLQEVPRAALGLSVPVEPGPLRVTVRIPGQADHHTPVDITAGALVEVKLAVRVPVLAAPAVEPALADTAPAAAADRPLRPWALAALSVGVAALASFAVFAVLADRQYQDLERQCALRPCSEDPRAGVDRGQRLDTLANVSLVGGLIFSGVGGALWWSD